MAVTYDLLLKSPLGVPLAVLDRFISFEYQRVVNDVGQLTVILPWGAYPQSLFDDDNIIELWRTVDNHLPYLEGDTVFFIQTVNKRLSANGEKVLEVIALDPLQIVHYFFVQYAASSPQADKSGPSDDMTKAIIRENMGTLATDATRAIPYITVQSDLSLGPSTSKAFSRRNVLTVIQEIADDAFTKGTYLAFDLVSTNPASGVNLDFRTYINTRGVDHRWPSSANPILLDPENGNLSELVRGIDNRAMENAVSAGGQGDRDLRTVATSFDLNSINQDPWNRHEAWVNARNVSDPASVQAEADAELRAMRERKTFSGRFVDTPGIRYGVHFKFGDYLTCVWDGEQFDMRANSVGIKVADKQETLTVILRSD